MGKREIIDPIKKMNSPYSAAVEADGWVYVSGQGPLDVTTGQVVPGTVAEETRRTLDNVKRVLEAAGCTIQDVVKANCYIQDIAMFDEFSETFREYFSQGIRPARTTVAGGLKNIKVEIDVVAYKGKNR